MTRSSQTLPEGQGRVTLWGVEIFLAVAEEGAISAAARRLGVSPSAISQQLTGLEAALGAVLLDRSARPMRLTPAGAMFRRHAQVILNAEAEARISNQSNLFGGVADRPKLRPPRQYGGTR